MTSKSSNSTNRIEPTVELETSSGSSRFTATTTTTTTNNNQNRQGEENLRHYPLAPVGFTEMQVNIGSTSGHGRNREDENLRHYPLAPSSVIDHVQTTPLATINEKVQFQRRLAANYPAKYVLYLALAILILNVVILYFEISLNQMRYYKYHTWYVGKYAVITSIGNNMYALLAIFTVKFRNYFLIQLMSLLHLVGFFGTAFFPVFLNIFSFILSALEGSCQGRCLLVEAITIIAAFMSAVFSMTMFVKIQFNFLTNLNRNTFATFH